MLNNNKADTHRTRFGNTARFFIFQGLYSLEKEHKIAKINLGLSHRPCSDDSFPGPERELGIMHSVYTIENFSR